MLFSHSTLGTQPLNNEESIESGKDGVCEGGFIRETVEVGCVLGYEFPRQGKNIQRKKVSSNFFRLSKN